MSLEEFINENHETPDSIEIPEKLKDENIDNLGKGYSRIKYHIIEAFRVADEYFDNPEPVSSRVISVYSHIISTVINPEEESEDLYQKIVNTLFDEYTHPRVNGDILDAHKISGESEEIEGAFKEIKWDSDKKLTPVDIDIKSIDGYKEDADGYIYVLKVHRLCDDEIFYYVGKSDILGGGYRGNGEANVKGRIETHKRKGGDFRMPMPSALCEEELIITSDSIHRSNVEIETKSITSYYKSEYEPKKHFGARMREQERRKAFELSKKHQTLNIIGGK